MFSVIYAAHTGFAHLKAPVDGALGVGVFHLDFLKDQVNVIQHQTISAIQ